MSVLFLVLLLWCVVYIFAKFFEALTSGTLSLSLSRSSRHRRNAFNFQFGYISVYTTRFNSSIQSFAQSHRFLFRKWFKIGSLISLIGLLLSLYLLISNLALLLPPSSPSLPSSSSPLHIRRPRIPFFQSKPWFLPHFLWLSFIPADHTPASVILPPDHPNLHEYVTRLAIQTWQYGLLHHRHRRKHRRPSRPKHLDSLNSNGPCRQGELNRHAYFRKLTGHMYGPHTSNFTRSPPRLNIFARPSIHRHRRRHHQSRSSQQQQQQPPPPPSNLNHHQPFSPVNRRRRLLAVPPPHLSDDDNNNDKNSDPNNFSYPSNNHTKSPSSSSDHHQLNPPVSTSSSNSESRWLTPLVPGVTVPVGDVWYMLISVLISAIVHELGHALAASTENGVVSGIGAFIVLILPGAYVRLRGIETLKPEAQLRIYCAGAWHNVLSGLIALFVLYLLPFLSSPFYLPSSGSGALVVDVPDISPMYGSLHPGDVIVKLGRHSVVDGGESFRNAIGRLEYNRTEADTMGFCVGVPTLRAAIKPHVKCCQSKKKRRRAGLHGMATNGGGGGEEEQSEEGDGNGVGDDDDESECYKVVSLTSREVCVDPSRIGTFHHSCRTRSDCPSITVATTTNSDTNSNSSSDHVSSSSDNNSTSSSTTTTTQRATCVVPVLDSDKQLIDVMVRAASSRSLVHYYYEGYPTILGQGVTVSSYVPRLWESLPHMALRLVATFDLPNMIERLLQYFTSISFGLAIMNMAPVLYLDGEASVGLFITLVLERIPMKHSQRAKIAHSITSGTLITGSALLVINLALSIYRLP